MVKSLTAPWQVGGRSKSWIKIKPDYVENVSLAVPDLDLPAEQTSLSFDGCNHRSLPVVDYASIE